jgi:ADP-ribose pyrophosphatase
MEARRLGSSKAYEGRIIDVTLDRVLLPNGSETELEVVRHPGASAMVPLEEDGTVLLIHQYRWAAEGFILEVPAGKLDGNEAPEACARRELEEEIGRVPGRLDLLGSVLTTPGFTDEIIHLYLARGLASGERRPERDEVIETRPVPLEKVPAMIARGEIRDAKSICALLMAIERLEREGRGG